MGGQHLLLQPADGQHPSPQGDLPRHGHIPMDRTLHQGRDERRGDGDPRRRPILGDSSLGDVDVDVQLLEGLGLDPQLVGVGASVAQGRLGRLLHHLPQLPGQDQLPLALHEAHLDGDDVAASLRHRHPRGHADLVLLLGGAVDELGRPQILGRRSHGDVPGRALALGRDPGHLAADVGNLPLQVPHPRLVSVLADDVAQGRVGEAEGVLLQPMLIHLAGDEEPLGDLELLLLNVARELDDLHAVPQGGRDGGEDVGRGDEDHLGQVIGHVQVVVGKGVVLLGVQHLQQGRRGVASEINAHLINLVQHEEGIEGPRPPHGLDDAARQGPDVGAAMASDLRLVADAAQADAHELPPQRLGDGPPQGGLARAWRPHEAEDGASHLVGRQLADGDVLQDPLLGLGQAIVVLLQDLRRPGDVYVVLGLPGPGQLDEPVEVGADDAHLGGGGGHLRQPPHLLLRLLLHLVGHLGGADLLLQLVDLPGHEVALAQLALDGPHLLPQVILPLALVHLILHLGVDLVLQLQQVQLLGQEDAQLLQPGRRVEGLQDLLALGYVQLHDGRDQVRQPARIVHVHGRHVGILGQRGAQFHTLFEEGQGGPSQRLQCHGLFSHLEDGRHPGVEVGLRLRVFEDLDPPLALGQDAGGAIRHAQHSPDGHLGADGVEVVGGGVFDLHLLLGHDDESVVAGDGRLYCPHRTVPPHEEGSDHVRKEYRIPHREERVLIQNGCRPPVLGASRYFLDHPLGLQIVRMANPTIPQFRVFFNAAWKAPA